MQQVSLRLPRRPSPDTRTLILLVATVALLLLAVSAYYLNAFRGQRLEAQRNSARLAQWQEQLLTATPAALEQERLQAQLALVQQRFAGASGLLPRSGAE
ncbi:MAG: hypothetical protein ACRDIB_14435, partial [Ardenticatenaceae bacterium]